MARRRTTEEIERSKRSGWILLLKEGFCGYRSCCKCGEVAHCRGRYYHTQRCYSCFK